MQSHDVKRNTPRKESVQIGRGGRRGKTSGKGHKGQKSRAGTSMRPEMRDLIKKIPKLRGRGVNTNKSRKDDCKVVSLTALEENYKSGERVTVQSLFDKGLVRKISGSMPSIKIVSTGELKKKLEVTGVATTKSAKEAIANAGGKII